MMNYKDKNYNRIDNDLKKKVLNKVFADNIKHFQEEKNMTTRKLSHLTGISESGLRNYRSGIRFPDNKRLNIIAQALNVTIRDLKRKRDVLGLETLTNIEETLISFNFSEDDLNDVFSELEKIYCSDDWEENNIPINNSNISQAISLCKNIINQYIRENKIKENISNFVIPLLDEINTKHILSVYSVPVYGFHYLKSIIRDNLQERNNYTPFLIERKNLKSNSNYFGVLIDTSFWEEGASFEKNTTLILEETTEISSDETGLFGFDSCNSKFIDLLKVEYVDSKAEYITRLVPVQDYNLNLLPYSLKEKDIIEYKLKLYGVIRQIYLPNESSTETLKF